MKTTKEQSLTQFECWGEGTSEFIDEIICSGNEEAFEYYIEKLYPEGIDEIALNDILRYEQDEIREIFGMSIPDEDNDE